MPRLPRQYREHKKLAPSYDIAGNIIIQVGYFDMKVPTSEAMLRPEDYGTLVRECLLSRESDGGDHEGLHQSGFSKGWEGFVDHKWIKNQVPDVLTFYTVLHIRRDCRMRW